ncbi:caspase family protein [Empedobacter tilapiae]|uniref:Caspase family protein n=1 Tax=Empedobacter tilapiae TaxID=2491114 RepID=A0A4Z1AXT2_9FLAO|nr:caspase family protein [Empedobacter tilapiae]TGN22538.1 caspase family protein [Empedobacter tilapiae]
MGKNYLFVIAIDKYSNGKILPLNNAVLDASKLIKILNNKYSFDLILEPLFNEKATRKNIIDDLNRISYLITKEDSLIIYFAGHGELNPLTNRGYWVPFDADKSISDFVPNSTIIDILSGIDVKHLLLIIDSCFSGSFFNQSRSIYDHYQKLNSLNSRWIISSGRNEKVSDGSIGEGSPFSIILTEYLNKNSERTFSVGELAVAVTKGVGSISKQQPLFGSIRELGHQNGQLVFNINKTSVHEVFNHSDCLNKIVISYETSKILKENGMSQESIFAYYNVNDKIILKKYDTETNFLCSAFTYEELAEFIPQDIKVDKHTFIASYDGYDQLGDLEKGSYDYASVTFQRTDILENPFMAICRCNDRMIAFSKTKEGYYNNLIAWGKNQAETAGLMWKMLKDENKV